MNSTRPKQFPWCLMPAVLGVLLLGGGATLHANSVSKEYQLKAAFLYNFIKFVEWPPQRFEDKASPIVIGVLGRDPFDGELQKIVNGRRVDGRSIRVRAVSIAEASSVHLVFVPAGDEDQFVAARESLRGVGVLTVGESDRFAAHDGMITFVREADKLRFAINQAAAAAVGIRISAQLLKLATEVRRKP